MGDQVLSVTSSKPSAANFGQQLDGGILNDTDLRGDQGSGNSSGVDVVSWAHELLGNLRHAENDQAASLVTQQFLRAYETQAAGLISQKRDSLANANRILIKTLQRIHRQHKEMISIKVPNLQRELEEAKRRSEFAESRLQVLQCHLDAALAVPGAGTANRGF